MVQGASEANSANEGAQYRISAFLWLMVFFQLLVLTSKHLRPWQLLPLHPHLVRSSHTIHFHGPRGIPSFLPFSPTLKDKARWAAHCG